MLLRILLIALLLTLPRLAYAADVTGIAKIRDADHVMIGSTRIRLGGVDAPGVDQLCLNAEGERWTCGASARDALTKHTAGKPWTCKIRRTDKFGQSVARCMVDGEDIQKWLVANGWALAFLKFSRDFEAEEAAAKSAKAGLWAGAFFAPWDWAVRNKNTAVRGSLETTVESHAILLASASGPVAPSPACTIKGNVNRAGECIYHTPQSRWYAKINMRISKGTRWFCSKEEAEAAGCRETRR